MQLALRIVCRTLRTPPLLVVRQTEQSRGGFRVAQLAFSSKPPAARAAAPSKPAQQPRPRRATTPAPSETMRGRLASTPPPVNTIARYRLRLILEACVCRHIEGAVPIH